MKALNIIVINQLGPDEVEISIHVQVHVNLHVQLQYIQFTFKFKCGHVIHSRSIKNTTENTLSGNRNCVEAHSIWHMSSVLEVPYLAKLLLQYDKSPYIDDLDLVRATSQRIPLLCCLHPSLYVGSSICAIFA